MILTEEEYTEITAALTSLSEILTSVTSGFQGLLSILPFGQMGGEGGEGGNPLSALFGGLFGSDKEAEETAKEEKVASPLEKVIGNLEDLPGKLTQGFDKVALNFDDLLDQALKNLAELGKMALGNLLKQILPGGAGEFLSGIFGFAGGGRVQPGRAVLVGERGPELVVPDGSASIFNAGTTEQISRNMQSMMRGATAMMAAGQGRSSNNTQVIVQNYSGEETETRRRRDGQGDELIEVIIGRVAEDMAKGGRTADAAGTRFGLSARGT